MFYIRGCVFSGFWVNTQAVVLSFTPPPQSPELLPSADGVFVPAVHLISGRVYELRFGSRQSRGDIFTAPVLAPASSAPNLRRLRFPERSLSPSNDEPPSQIDQSELDFAESVFKNAKQHFSTRGWTVFIPRREETCCCTAAGRPPGRLLLLRWQTVRPTGKVSIERRIPNKLPS